MSLPLDRKPRVLMFTATLGYGGSESALRRLAQFLGRGMSVTIALMAQDYGSADYSNKQSDTDLPVVVLDDGRHAGRSLLSKARRWWRMLIRLRALKREHDVTISFLSGPNLLNALAGRRFPSIVSERGSKLHHVGISLRRKWLWLRILDPLTYRLAGRIVPVSVDYAEEVAVIAGPRLAHKIVPIEGDIDAADLIARTEAPVDTDIERFCRAPTIVSCGRLDRGKGVDLLLPVFARVRRRHAAARLLVIGDGPLRESLLDQCAALGLTWTDHGDPGAEVFFAGYRSDPMRYFRLCRVFCFPSLHEGLSNALIEGVASGIPVLAADCPYGPRSILAGPGDIAQPDPDQLPLRMTHGTLMPLPDTLGGAEVWERVICGELARPARRRSVMECRDAVARFDLEVTGHQWAMLVHELATTDSVEDVPDRRTA